MKVVAINGSPKAEGNTARALQIVAEVLKENGVETEVFHLGMAAGCTGCYSCAKRRDGTCVLPDDGVNACIQAISKADGVLIGAPVYYSSIPGRLKGVLDRIVTVAGNNGGLLRHKVGAPVIVARRIGALPAFDTIMHYLAYSEMVVPCSNNWNTVFGRAPGEIELDPEGVQTLRILGENMAWVMHSLANSRDAVPAPALQKKRFLNMVRE